MRFLQFQRRFPGNSSLGTFFIWDIVRFSLFVMVKVLYRHRRFGAENVPRTAPVIYVCNHQSHLDPVLVGVAVHDRPFASMARDSLFDPPFGFMIKACGAIPIKRGQGDRAAVRALLQALEEGRSVLVFPEGTRSPDGTIREFKPGFLLLMKRSGVPLQPCAVDGAYDAWPRGRSLPRLRGRTAVKVGELMYPSEFEGLSDKETIERVRHRIDEIRLEMRAKLRAWTKGRIPAPGPADDPLPVSASTSEEPTATAPAAD